MKNFNFNALIFTIFLIPSLSCSFFEDDDYIYYQWASVDKVEVINNQNGKLDLKITLSVPDPCHEFHTKEVKTSNDTLFVKYYSKVKKGTVCIQIIGEISIRDTFQLQSGKTYLFRFYQLENKYLDTLIKVN
ncbi:MAG: hypothetical protein N3F03_08795 [Ignavibacteria bacterium]|nr:hypothetical protein [Ignavibacteria bacterium]